MIYCKPYIYLVLKLCVCIHTLSRSLCNGRSVYSRTRDHFVCFCLPSPSPIYTIRIQLPWYCNKTPEFVYHVGGAVQHVYQIFPSHHCVRIEGNVNMNTQEIFKPNSNSFCFVQPAAYLAETSPAIMHMLCLSVLHFFLGRTNKGINTLIYSVEDESIRILPSRVEGRVESKKAPILMGAALHPTLPSDGSMQPKSPLHYSREGLKGG